MEKQIRVYSKTPIVEYKEWVAANYGKLNSEKERQDVFDRYYEIRHINKFNILDSINKTSS